MTLTQPQSQETNLVGRLVTSELSTTGLTLYVQFTDRKTGDARTPQSSTKLFTLDKDNERFEMIFADSHSTTDGVTTITVNASGRGLNKYGNMLGSATGNRHPINSEIGCADVHIPVEILNQILRGTEGTGANTFKVGAEDNGDVYIYINNGDVNKPYLKYVAASNKMVFSNNGVSETDVGGGTGSISAGDGISILAGVVAVAGGTQISSADTNANYIENKLLAGTGVTLTKGNTGADETLTIAADLTAGGTVTHNIYTPAYLTGGGSATSNYLLWLGTSDGEFTITIDGVAYDITGLDFTGVISMDDVATVIQTAIRISTGSLETVAWSVDHFVITSGDTTVASEVSVTSAVGGGTGTDISGVAATDPNMDADTGNGTATVAVLDPTASAGTPVVLNADGIIDKELLADYAAKGSLLVATEANTVEELVIGSNGTVLIADSAETTGVKWGSSFSAKGQLNYTEIIVANTTTETNLISLSVPANTLGTNNGIKFRMDFSAIDTDAANSVTFKLKYGSTTLCTLTKASLASPTDGYVEGYLLASGATGTQKAIMSYFMVYNLTTTTFYDKTEGTATEDSTGALDLKLTVTHSVASATNTITATSSIVEYIR